MSYKLKVLVQKLFSTVTIKFLNIKHIQNRATSKLIPRFVHNVININLIYNQERSNVTLYLY